MKDFYKQFCVEGFDENGVLNFFEPVVPEGFNFSYDVVDRIARMEPDKRAMVWTNAAGEEKVFTFGDMSRYASRAANVFAARGVGRGDRVMLILKRHYQFWFAILGLHKLGAIGVPATNLLTTKDILYRYEAADIDAIVCTGEGQVAEYADEAGESYCGIRHKWMTHGSRPGWLDFDEELEQAPEAFARRTTQAEDPMLLYFTSGTVGYPKMVAHDFSYPLAHIITARYWHNAGPDDLHLTVSETGWMKSMWGKLYGQWLVGACVFVYDFDKFIPHDLLHMIEKYRITTFCAPPTIYRFFIKEGMQNYDLSSLRYATTAGEALNPEVFNRFYEYTGLSLMEGFGQTETTLQTVNFVGMTPKPGSMGKPSPLYDLLLADEDGNPVKDGEVGEIVLRLPDKGWPLGMFRGYYKGDDLTREAFRDGLYHTGDTAWRDEDGYMWYVGRNDDVIKASGYRIGPFEIESVLMEHPAVLECAVTGAPDPIRGTVVKATVILTKTYLPSDELKHELQEFVKHQTAPYKYPRILEFAPELPKTISGKIRRSVIRAMSEVAGE
jgi:acetyl-CoA synthetase